MHHGDIRLGDTIDIKFCTVNTSGVPTTLSGTPVVSAYPDNSITELTAGITLTVDFDARTGLNNVRVVATSGNGYATATNYELVITTGTVGGSSVVGYVVGSFSIEKRSALMPTTAARTLDVSTTGEAGVDWANVGGQGTTVNLSATTTNIVNTATAVTTLNGIAANVITAAATAADFGTEMAAAVWNEDATGHQTQGSFGQVLGDSGVDTNTIYGAVVTGAAGATVAADIISIQADTDDIQTRLPAALVGGRMASNAEVVGDKTGYSIAAGGIAAGALTTAALNEIADALLDRNMTTGTDSGTNTVRTVRQALRTVRNKVDVGAGIVYKEDDTTTSYSFTVTTAAGNPITVFDPASV